MKLSGETRLLLIMSLIILLGGAGMFFVSRTPTLAPPPSPTPLPIQWTPELFRSTLAAGRHVKESARPPRLTIIEFGDFECPSCRRAYNTYLLKLEAAMPIRLCFYNYPLAQHTQALPAAAAAEAAGRQGKFWEMFGALYQGIDTTLSSSLYPRLALKIGLDKARFDKDSADPASAAAVLADQRAANEKRIFQTPTFIVRDEKTGRVDKVTGAADLDKAVSAMTGTPLLLPPSSPAP